MKEDDEPDRPLRLFTPLYWVAFAFGLAMIVAGAAVGMFGARWPSRPHTAHPVSGQSGRALTAHRVRGKEPADFPKIR